MSSIIVRVEFESAPSGHVLAETDLQAVRAGIWADSHREEILEALDLAIAAALSSHPGKAA
jgi:hypothetical protein